MQWHSTYEHQTPEIAKLQVGDSTEANFIASTVIEIEMMIPLLQELKQEGRKINILYEIGRAHV